MNKKEPQPGAKKNSNGEQCEPSHEKITDLSDYGALKGSAANHNGKTSTPTNPNSEAQAEVIIDAHKRAGITPESGSSVEAHDVLLAAAEAGLFLSPEAFRSNAEEFPFTRSTLGRFEKRSYSVRHPRPEDLPALVRLEEECWPLPLCSSPDEIRERIERFPEGHCVLVMEGRVVGVLYSQRIAYSGLLQKTNAKEVSQLHTGQGPVIQLLAVNVLPEVQSLGLGDQLLEFVLQYASLQSGIEKVVAVTRCKNYHRHRDISYPEYLRKRDGQGLLLDPILRFHDVHGAFVKCVIPGYRPLDHDNQGNGVLIEYDIRKRQPKDLETMGEVGSLSNDLPAKVHEQVCSLLEEAVRSVLGPHRESAFSPRRPFMDMGLDSLDLFEIRTILSQRLAMELKPTLFFQYSTPEAMARYVQDFLSNSSDAKQGADSILPPARKRTRAPSCTGSDTKRSDPCDDTGLKQENFRSASSSRAYPAQDGVAIIGMACRFPNSANSIDEFWYQLKNGIDGICEVPSSRWNVESYYDPAQDKPGKIVTRFGGFIDGVDAFDAPFFGISPREANLIDPQQRILLETVHEALEQAGLSPESLAGSETGVFTGMFSHDYELIQVKQNSKEDYDGYFSTGNAASVAAGRLSYLFDFQGPAITVDTACSSSLVAVHLACKSLLSGECSLALASGVNLLLSPESSIAFSRAGMLSTDGRCKTFDSRSNGYVRSEGCGVVVLKRLSEAVADNDTILAVVRGTAVNQDGSSNGLTAPNGLAQEAVIRKALSSAGVSPSEVSYIEAHGTGTPLGDPVEVHALQTVYGKGRDKENPLVIGSVKTNIGHTEAAAGIAGLIKVVLSMQNHYIPPHLHFQKLNPHISGNGTPVIIPAVGREWTAPPGRPRFAGVSSFGFSGTNAHVILEEAPDQEAVERGVERPLHLLTLSAKSDQALRELAEKYIGFLGSRSKLDVGDVCFTANTGRSHFHHRLSLAIRSSAEICEKLSVFTSGKVMAGMSSGEVKGARLPQIAFLFTGQGSQYPGMGRELYETQPAFRKSLHRCDEVLRPYLEKPLLQVLYPEQAMSGVSGLLDETGYTQPALFALEYSLAELWKSWGIEPSWVMGHSVGEYVAACVAGIFSLEDGLKLIAERARLMQVLPRDGDMVAVMADEEKVSSVIRPYEDKVSIAAINGPQSIVISGEQRAVQKVVGIFQSEGIKTHRLTVSHAFHSPLMEPMLSDFERVAGEINYLPPRIALISNVSGGLAGEEITTPAYWVRHVREPVRFSASMKTLSKLGCGMFVEIGPRPILLGMGRRCLPEETGVWLPSLGQGQSDWQTILQSLGELYVRGASIDWPGLDRDTVRSKVALPTYPWQRKRYWIETNGQGAGTQIQSRSGSRERTHPLLGRRLHSALKQVQFEADLSSDVPSYLKDHCVFQKCIAPAAAFLEMALAAGFAHFQSDDLVVRDVAFQKALVLSEDRFERVQFVLDPEKGSEAFFQLFHFQSDEEKADPSWLLHASGKVSVHEQAGDTIDLASLQARCGKEQSVASYYKEAHEREIDYGPSFQVMKQLWTREQEALCRIQLPESLQSEARDYLIHPVLLDAAFQLVNTKTTEGTYIPIRLKRLTLFRRPGNQVWSHARVRPREAADPETVTADLYLFGPDGKALVQVEGLEFKKVLRDAMLEVTKESLQSWLYEVQWRHQSRRGRDLPPEYLPSPEEVSHRLMPELNKIISPAGMNRELLEQFESLTLSYVLQALQKLGWKIQENESMVTAEFAIRLGIVPQHSRLMERCLEMLREEGIVTKMGEAWRVLRVPEIKDPQRQWQKIFDQYPEASAELALIGRCGTNLAAVLRGECDPVQLLFPEADLTEATSLYQDAPTFGMMNRLVRKAVCEALDRLPCGRSVRMLELGAGTGGTTAHILPHLPAQQTEYIFTDLSTLFTNKARDRFVDYPFVRYQLLNIEEDPAAQGFTLHQQDLILAANVLHATRDMHQTLRHVRKLLAPGGLLVLLEGTARRRWIDLIFGQLEGWWKFSDHDLRPSHPLLSTAQWEFLLKESGFESSVSLSPDDGNHGSLFQQAVIIAKADRKITVESKRERGRWLVLADSEGTGESLASQLKANGEACTLVFEGEAFEQVSKDVCRIDPSHPEDFQRLLKEMGVQKGPPLRGIVHLWSLNTKESEHLTRKKFDEASHRGCGSTLSLVQAVVNAELAVPPRLWLVTRGAQAVEQDRVVSGLCQSPLWGMAKVISLEHPELQCVSIDFDPERKPDETETLFEEVWSESPEDQVAFRGRSRFTAKLVRNLPNSDRLEIPENQPYNLSITARGTLANLKLEPLVRRSPGAGEVEIAVRATGLNFRDVLNALDLYPGDPGPLGLECSGEIVALGPGVEGFEPGQRVAAMAADSFGQYVTVNAAQVAPLPDAFSFEDAATIPIVFLTAYYTLHHLAKISQGDRVLIHAAAGGVGQAAIQLAQRAGAEVFATASPGKWDLLRSMGVKQVMNSRTLSFADEVMAMTQHQGVDIVLNSLTGEFIPKSLSVLKRKGHFLEIGKRGVWSAQEVAALKPEISFSLVDLIQVCEEDPGLIRSMLKDLMALFRDGSLKPLQRKVFPVQDAVHAFRTMQQARHTGKIVVSHPDKKSLWSLNGSVRFRDEGTYLITGGLGGLGLLVARWMVDHGARHLILAGRNIGNSDALEQVGVLEQIGAKVSLVRVDVTRQEDVARMLSEIQDMPTLRGIIHAAGVLEDGVLMQQSWERFQRVLEPKVDGSWNLHALIQNYPLDFFVLFSSTASLFGNSGQCNHAAANAFMDALAHDRRARGLPCLSINWGGWSEVGAAARRNVGEQWKKKGVGTIPPGCGLEILEQIFAQNPVQVGVAPIQWAPFLKQWPSGGAPSYFSEMIPRRGEQEEARELRENEHILLRQLKSEKPEKLYAALLHYLRIQVTRVLRLDLSLPLDPDQSLNELGLDSLTGIELKNRINTELEANVPLEKFFDDASLSKWAKLLVEKFALENIREKVSLDLEVEDNFEEVTL